MSTISAVLLPSVYFGPVQWYSKLLQFPQIEIEQHEHYIKQSWRNRCRIIGPNGIHDLIIPIHLNGNHTPMNEVRIDYDGIWQRQHWQSIRSAYGNSPFFEFYTDYFAPYYSNKKWELLLDYNTEILKLTLKLLKLDVKPVLTTAFNLNSENVIDFRKIISPKIALEADPSFKPEKYVQVFQERHGFVPNLSVIDLLCCNGPASKEILQLSIVFSRV